jgi:hypothetical protein
MDDNEQELAERMKRWHEARANLPIIEKLKIMDQLQEATALLTKWREEKIDEEPRLPMDDPEPSVEMLIECVQGEIAYRLRVYPRRIEAGAMTEQFALQQIRLMESVLKNLERQREPN